VSTNLKQNGGTSPLCGKIYVERILKQDWLDPIRKFVFNSKIAIKNNMELYQVIRYASGCCDQHPSSHNNGFNHCVDCNDKDKLKYREGIKINYVSCGGSKCPCSLDQWDNTPLYCISCYGSEKDDQDLQDYITKRAE
jgi:hypothetical protein